MPESRPALQSWHVSDLAVAKLRFEGKLVRYRWSRQSLFGDLRPAIEEVGICIAVLPYWEHARENPPTREETRLVIRIKRLGETTHIAKWMHNCTIDVYGEEQA